jgi:hypothetical protein
MEGGGGALLAWPTTAASPQITMEIYISNWTHKFQNKTGLDAKANSELYKSTRVCSVLWYHIFTLQRRRTTRARLRYRRSGRTMQPGGSPMWSPRAKGVMEEWDRFDHTVAALSKRVIQLCFNVVAHPDDDEPYSVLKEDLYSSILSQISADQEADGGWAAGQPSPHTAPGGDNGVMPR